MTTTAPTTCRWHDDRCQHGANIDDRDVTWDPDARKLSCPTSQHARQI